MSIDIRNLRNEADKARKENELLASLRRQAKLAENYNQALTEQIQNRKLNITPVAPEGKSVEEERQDVIFQRQTFFNNAKTIMSPVEAQKLMTDLTDDQIYLVNSNFKDILTELKGRTNLDANFFRRFLEKYTQKQAKTRTAGPGTETGIQIAIGEEEIANLRNAIGRASGAVIARVNYLINNPPPGVVFDQATVNAITQAIQDAVGPIDAAQIAQIIAQQTGADLRVIQDRLRDIGQDVGRLDRVLGNIERNVPANLAGQIADLRRDLGNGMLLNEQRFGEVVREIQATDVSTKAKLDVMKAAIDALNRDGSQPGEEKKEEGGDVIIDTPPFLLDQISGDFYDDPVVADDGNTYSRATFNAIRAANQNGLAGVPLGPQVQVNRAMRDAVDYFRARYQPTDATETQWRYTGEPGGPPRQAPMGPVRQMTAEEAAEAGAQALLQGVNNSANNEVVGIRYRELNALSDAQLLSATNAMLSRNWQFANLYANGTYGVPVRAVGQNAYRVNGAPARMTMIGALLGEQFPRFNVIYNVAQIPSISTMMELAQRSSILRDIRNANTREQVREIIDRLGGQAFRPRARQIRDIINTYFIVPPTPPVADGQNNNDRWVTNIFNARNSIPQGQDAFFIYPNFTNRPDDVPVNPQMGFGMMGTYGHTKIMKPRHRRVVGRGISSDENERYIGFGKYLLHVPSLKRGILNLKFPSFASIPTLKQTPLSRDLLELISDLIETNELNKRLYSRMSQEDQDYFYTIAQKAEIDQTLGMGIRVNDTHRKEMERFTLLRGQIIAGNNNPEVLREMKQYIVKFMRDGTMNKHQGTDLLFEISCLS
jgi:hypothetical protein